jgi:hypothetical protein
MLEHVVRFLHRINMRLVHHYSSKVSLVLCAVKTMAAHTRKYNELDEESRTKQIQLVSKAVLDRFEDQMLVVAKGAILNRREKQEMIDTIAREVRSLARDTSGNATSGARSSKANAHAQNSINDD